ncbi:MAG: hypothetical protein ACT4O9_02305 [Blastocatellia bacterium]
MIGNRRGGDFRIEQRPYYYGTPYNYGYNRRPSHDDIPQYGQYNPQPVYNNYGSPYGNNLPANDFLNSLPIVELIGQFGGNDFISELLGNFLAQGYDEGFIAATNARSNAYDNENYEDPYAAEGGIYDSCSTSMADNRRIFSEGYELGYRDAMAGRQDYDPIENGNTDLVSLLLGTVLGES